MKYLKTRLRENSTRAGLFLLALNGMNSLVSGAAVLDTPTILATIGSALLIITKEQP